MNLMHFDYLILVWFITKDKNQIIEMVENCTFYEAQNMWLLSVGVTTTTNITYERLDNMLRIILLLSVGKGLQIDRFDISRLTI